MRTWLIIGLVTLAVGHPINKQENRPQKHQQERKQPQAPSSVSPAVTAPPGQPTPAPKQDSAKTEPNNSLCERLLEPLLSNWPLVAVGVAGIWAALRTLGVIRRQTEATETAANAAKASADAVINSERAWLLVEKIDREFLVPIEKQQQQLNAVFVNCRNFGKTVARMTAWKFVLQITERSDGPDAGNAYDLTGLSFNPSIIPQADPMPQVAILQSNGGFITQRQLDDIITNTTKFLWLCGIIKYEDVFRPGFEHETKFCYLYGTWIAGREPFFRLAGPPECNKAT